MSATKAFQLCLISTGGTIEKTYDELEGVLENRVSVLDFMLAGLQLRHLEITRKTLMNKDSLDMSEADHKLIAKEALLASESFDGVLIVHGTDRLVETGKCIYGLNPNPRKPIVLTGAMRPYELRHTDALQNLTEALLAVQILSPGTWCVMHNRALAFPKVKKDYTLGTFVETP